MNRPWHLNRRALLRGTGAAVALPWLEAMAPGAPSPTKLPKRMVVTYFSYGAYMPGGTHGITEPKGKHEEWSWWPCNQAGPLSFNRASAPFAPLRDSVSYVQGLDHAGGWGLGGHSSGDVFATGADMQTAQPTNAISVDQVAADVHGNSTRYGSLVVGTEGGTGMYGRAKTLSHYGPGRPIPSMHEPRKIFDRLFRPYAGKQIGDVRTELRSRRSVLDLVLDQSKGLNRRLGAADRAKMEEYLDAIRAAEKRIERVDRWTHIPLPEVDETGLRLDASPKEPEEFIRSFYDLIYLALRTDSTRFATFMTESEQSTAHDVGNYSNYVLGYSGNTHDIAHKRPADFAPRWDLWRAEQHAYFLNRLAETKEGDGSMLDNTVVLWGSAHPHASHNTQNYPLQVAGGGALGFQHGNLHRFVGEQKVPMANLLLSMLHAVDVPAKSFADSTGPLTALRKSS